MKKFSYTYTVLRYVHDVTTGEFVNIGIALHSADAKFAMAKCRTAYSRLRCAFPDFDGESLRSMVKHIQRRFDAIGTQLATELCLKDNSSVLSIAQSVLPKDDSSLQWSPVGYGVTDDPARTLDGLYERMITRYDSASAPERRSDDDVWRLFKRNLETKHLRVELQPKTIAVQDDSVDFERAWKNGVWHCFEPLSFDLASSDSIREKAHKWLGQITSVQGSPESFALYFLVGGPKQAELENAYSSALSILRKIPVATEIYDLDRMDDFATRIERQLGTHAATHIVSPTGG